MIHRLERRSNPWRARGFWIALIVGGGAAAGYYYLNPEKLPDWAARTELGRDLQRTTVYKWQDAEGRWHITGEPPPEGVSYRQETYTPDTNVLPLPPKLQD